MSAEHIGRRTVAFFLLTSLANVATLILFAAAFAVAILGGVPAPAVTYIFAAAGAGATAITLALPVLAAHSGSPASGAATPGRLRTAARNVGNAIVDGVRDAMLLLRQRSLDVLGGSLGYMAFDIAVLGVCVRAFGASPSLGVLVVAYLIGQLGGLLPLPGGIGGIEGGLIGAFALYHVPLAASTIAVLAHRACALRIRAVLGSIAFVQVCTTLQRRGEPAVVCQPLAEPI